jgi:hypothetical protein
MLTCAECGSESDDGRGWHSYLTIDGDAAIYCGPCVKREVERGDGRLRLLRALARRTWIRPAAR